MEIDGSDIEQIHNMIELASSTSGKSTATVADTVKGKGVSIFESQVRFYGGKPTEEEFKTAYAELDERIAELED